MATEMCECGPFDFVGDDILPGVGVDCPCRCHDGPCDPEGYPPVGCWGSSRKAFFLSQDMLEEAEKVIRLREVVS